MKAQRQFILATGIFLVILGLLGFMQNPVLGVFAADPINNALNLIFGFLAIDCAWQRQSWQWFAQVGGGIIGVLAIFDLLALRYPLAASIIPATPADLGFHLVLAGMLLYVGVRELAVAEPS